MIFMYNCGKVHKLLILLRVEENVSTSPSFSVEVKIQDPYLVILSEID